MRDSDFVPWLRGLAEKGGKGVVGNIDARCLGRIADEMAQLRADLASVTSERDLLRSALARSCDPARAKLLDDDMDMIDKVAEAIWRARNPDFGELTGYVDRGNYRSQARAAIEAMREPTPEMLNAAVDATGLGFDMSWRNKSPQKVAAMNYKAAIDAALGEKVG